MLPLILKLPKVITFRYKTHAKKKGLKRIAFVALLAVAGLFWPQHPLFKIGFRETKATELGDYEKVYFEDSGKAKNIEHLNYISM